MDDSTDFDYILVDEDPSCNKAGGEDGSGGGGDDEAKCPAPPRPVAGRKAPQSVFRLFELPEDHELAFDFFSGVPTLHARPRRHVPSPPSPPPQAAGLPSRVDFRSFVVAGPSSKDDEVLELLFWPPPSSSPEEEGIVIPAFRQRSSTLVGRCVHRTRRTLTVLRALATLFFTFSPVVVVLYGRMRGDKKALVLVAGEDDSVLVRRIDLSSPPLPAHVLLAVRHGCDSDSA